MNPQPTSLRRRVSAFFQLLTSILLLVSLNNQSIAAPQATFVSPTPEQYDKGLLWKITSHRGTVSYLFGTIHVEDPAIINLPSPVTKALFSSKSVTLEILPDAQAQASALAAMLYKDGRTLQQALGNSLYQRTVAALTKNGLPEQIIANMKPWAAMMILSVPKAKTGQFLDKTLYDKATARGMRTYALETQDEQLSVFNDMSEQDQIKMLERTLNDLAILPTLFKQLKQAWLDRDLIKLQAISEQQAPKDDPISSRFMNKLVNQRNQIMADRMQTRLKEGRAFIAVGALHLPGDHGLLNLLSQRGYSVQRVY